VSKIKNWIIFLLSLIGGALGLYFITDNDKEKLKKAKERIDKAGEDYEAKEFDDSDNAAKYIDDILSSIDGPRKE